MGRKPLFGENAKLVTIRLYSWEKILVKDFIKKIRDKKRQQIKKGNKNGTRVREGI